MRLTAAELAATAAEYRQKYADEMARWETFAALFGPDWWRHDRKAAVEMCRCMGALMTAASQFEQMADQAALAELVEDAGCTLDGAA